MKLNRVFANAMLLMMLVSVPVQAAEIDMGVYSDNVQQEESVVLLPEGTESSKDIVNSVERSSIISTASSEIIDETGGDIGVIIETLCHVECEKILNLAILDRLNEETGQWEEQSRYQFTAVKEDFPNTPLTYLTNSFTIENQKTGYYYRIRGIHSVTASDGTGQVYSTRTDGLLITEYGR